MVLVRVVAAVDIVQGVLSRPATTTEFPSGDTLNALIAPDMRSRMVYLSSIIARC